MAPRWVTALLDSEPGHADASRDFWAAASGCAVSAVRGDRDEFATLIPVDGDAYLRLQRLGSGAGGIHLDLHVDDPRAAADAAVAMGAVEVADRGYVVLRSPGGLTFCCVPSGVAGHRPAPVVRAGGHASAIDQVCVDIPASSYDTEVAFWSALTGWEDRATDLAEFRYLVRPAGQPLRLLMQRLGADDHGGGVRAHLDLASTDRAAEVAALRALGARRVGEGESWTVLADPVGRVFCVTERPPAPA